MESSASRLLLESGRSSALRTDPGWSDRYNPAAQGWIRPTLLAAVLVVNALVVALAARNEEMVRADFRLVVVFMLLAWLPLAASSASRAYYAFAPIVLVGVVLGIFVWLPYTWPVALGALLGLCLPMGGLRWLARLLLPVLAAVLFGLAAYSTWVIPDQQARLLVCLDGANLHGKAEAVFERSDRLVGGPHFSAVRTGVASVAIVPAAWASTRDVHRFIRAMMRPPIRATAVTRATSCP
jgi:hypothetical protein